MRKAKVSVDPKKLELSGSQKRKLKELFEWEERGKKKNFILGVHSELE